MPRQKCRVKAVILILKMEPIPIFTQNTSILINADNVAASEKPRPNSGTNRTINLACEKYITSSIPCGEKWRHVCISFLLLFQVLYKSS